MKTYKLGNKAKCIVRAYAAGKIGDETITYDNQPYTVLSDISVNIKFKDIQSDITSGYTDLFYASNSVSEVKLYDVLLTNKILNLIFPKSEALLSSSVKNYNSNNEKQIFLNLPVESIYQVFVYDDDGQLESAYGEYTENILTVEKENSNYLIFYSYLDNYGFSLNKPNNVYLKLDLELIGNTDDETTPAHIHIDKCGLRTDKDLSFNKEMNTVDLTFKVIDSMNDYITLENN